MRFHTVPQVNTLIAAHTSQAIKGKTQDIPSYEHCHVTAPVTKENNKSKNSYRQL